MNSIIMYQLPCFADRGNTLRESPPHKYPQLHHHTINTTMTELPTRSNEEAKVLVKIALDEEKDHLLRVTTSFC